MVDGLSPKSKLISLSRQTPALLDMAATENGFAIGQYSSAGTLGHSGDNNSTIGGVTCLHHELTIQPSDATSMKMYFLAGYSSKPLKAWRDSRVFWIVYDVDQEACWLVPHDLSHKAVGDTVSATMPLVSKRRLEDGTIRVIHLSSPVQASLSSASPLKPLSHQHKQFIDKCLEAARAIDWDAPAAAAKVKAVPVMDQVSIDKTASETGGKGGDKTGASPTMNIDPAVAVFDKWKITGQTSLLFKEIPQIPIAGKGGVSLSPMHGPLKVLASSCCAYSRVLVLDGSVTKATSEINAVSKQLSGIIFVQTDNPDIYKIHQIRWNMARAPRTPVLALTPDGCKHLCGPMPPCYVDEENPTPMAGSPISKEAIHQLIEFARSAEGDEYFGPLYQVVPSHDDAKRAIADYITDMESKDFASIDKEPEDDSDASSFTDGDFRRLMEVINILSVSTSTAVERNNLGIRIVKFIRKMTKKVATNEIENSPPLHKHNAKLEVLNGWTGDNVDWALERRDVLGEILNGSTIKIETQEGVEIDLALQTKLDEAIKKHKSQLDQTIRALKTGTHNKWEKTFNAVFQPPLEAIMRSIGDNPRYRNYFVEIKFPNMSGVIVRASQTTNKQTIASKPEDVIKLFHKMGASGFVSFTINFLQTWKSKVINEICVVDPPGQGFNNPETYAPVTHCLEDGPADPVAAYETDVRHQFVLPTFARLTKMIDDDDDDDDSIDEEAFSQMPVAPVEEDLAKYLLMRAEFMLRDPEQGPRQPMWQYVDWLFHQIKVIHQVVEKQAAPLAMRALAFSIARLMQDNPEPEKGTMEIVASIIMAISFMSARGDPIPHGCIDTFFSMDSKYVPQTKDMERDPWQVEVINIISRAVDYVRPIMSTEEYVQIRSNFQRAPANMVKRQIVQKLLDEVREEAKKNAESQEDYIARVNKEFYPAYREIVETIRMLLDADPKTFELTDDLRQRIDHLHATVVNVWANEMRRCRVGPVRAMAIALKAFCDKGGKDAITYLVKRRVYLENLYDVVYHIKYEACDHAMIEEVCMIIKAKTRNPEHEKHEKWLARVDRAIEDVSNYDKRMRGFPHGNRYKELPTKLMLEVLSSLKANPAGNEAMTFNDVRLILAHIDIVVEEPADLKVQRGDPDGKRSIFEQLRGAWWMCSDMKPEAKAPAAESSTLSVALIAMDVPGTGMPTSSNIVSILGDTYHKYSVARLFSGNLQPMRNFIRENYRFHVEWFEETIRAAGLPQHFDPVRVQRNEILAIYAVVQRLVHELVQDGSDRGDRARNLVYGEVVDPLTNQENLVVPPK